MAASFLKSGTFPGGVAAQIAQAHRAKTAVPKPISRRPCRFSAALGALPRASVLSRSRHRARIENTTHA